MLSVSTKKSSLKMGFQPHCRKGGSKRKIAVPQSGCARHMLAKFFLNGSSKRWVNAYFETGPLPPWFQPRCSCWKIKRKADWRQCGEHTDESKPFVVFLVRANPFPKKSLAGKFADGAVMAAHTHRPIRFADGYEMQRRMKSVGRSETVILLRQNPNVGGQHTIQPPEFGCSSAGNGHDSHRMSVSGIVLPAACSASAES
jgi:hypothetical protein